MRYGIDVHGTLALRKDGGIVPSALFPLLTSLMAAWVERGEEVYVLSGPPVSVILDELRALGLEDGVHFTHVESMVDFLRTTGESLREDPPGSGMWWCDEGPWIAAKGRIAAKYGIDVVVDDTAAYRAAMPAKTTFCLVSPGPL